MTAAPSQHRLTGSCHCGGVVFDVPKTLDFGSARRCDCSLCRRRWAVMVSCPIESLHIQQGHDLLSLYQWNTQTAKHYFCKICGIYTFHQRRADPSVYGVNVTCLEGVTLADFEGTKIADGVSLSGSTT